MQWNTPDIRTLIRLALAEDDSARDVTTQATIGPAWQVRAQIRAKQHGIVAGLPLAALIFKTVDKTCVFKRLAAEGTRVRSREILARISGRARAILTAERPALNALQHLSGIASYTHRQVGRLNGTPTKLLDTRKTLPGWRRLEKYAVLCGGGTNHRMSLGDAILIKDNHLRICRLARADWQRALRRFSRRNPGIPIQVEIQTQRDLYEAIAVQPRRVLLDNLPPRQLKAMIHRLRRTLPRTEIEVSGGVKPQDLPRLGRLGVERISMGKLTHSAPSFDCSLEITHVDTH